MSANHWMFPNKSGASLSYLKSLAIQIIWQPQGKFWPDVHQDQAQDHDEHVRHHAGKNLIDGDVRRRHPFQIER